jgi:hypothetical protein
VSETRRACALVLPLYLDFVEVLLCRYDLAGGIESVRALPLRRKESALAAARTELPGVALERVPMRDVVEDLAHAIVADRRAGRAPSPTLARYIDLFAPELSDGDGVDGSVSSWTISERAPHPPWRPRSGSS